MGGDLEARRCGLGPGPRAACIHGQHEHLRTEVAGDFVDDVGTRHGGCVDRRLVGPETEQLVHFGDPADTPSDGEGNEDFLGGAADHVEGGLPVARGGCDIQERELVRAGVVVAVRQLDRISGVAEPFEIDAFDHAAGINVQARDDANGYSHDFSCLLQSFVKVPAVGREGTRRR
jgi:hypothetical protein